MNFGITDSLDFDLTNDFGSKDLLHLVTTITGNGSFNNIDQNQQ